MLNWPIELKTPHILPLVPVSIFAHLQNVQINDYETETLNSSLVARKATDPLLPLNHT